MIVMRAVPAWLGAVLFPFALLTFMPHGPQQPSLSQVVLIGTLTALPFGLVRRWPAPALAVLLGGAFLVATTIHDATTGLVQGFVVDAAVGIVAATRRRWMSAVTAVGVAVAQVSTATFYSPSDGDYVGVATLALLGVGIAWAAGDSVRQRRLHAAELQARGEQQAVTAERLRIARELHDVVAHHIGVIAIQAGMGRRVIDSQPDEARNALLVIEETSRETLAGLRRTVGMLRHGEDSERRGPQPGLAQLDDLVATARAGGLKVVVERRGDVGHLPADIDLAAFRIVQEAVTNVVRHAAGARDCRVIVERSTDDRVAVEVLDDGRGRESTVGGEGFGIIGMRERAAMVGGTFSAGPRQGGAGFRVAAMLPVPAESPPEGGGGIA